MEGRVWVAESLANSAFSLIDLELQACGIELHDGVDD
jgi:hypothetical protein